MTRPDEAIQKARAELLGSRIERVRETLRLFDAGQMSAAKAVSLFEEIASGEADRIVRVGQEYKPEIQS